MAFLPAVMIQVSCTSCGDISTSSGDESAWDTSASSCCIDMTVSGDISTHKDEHISSRRGDALTCGNLSAVHVQKYVDTGTLHLICDTCTWHLKWALRCCYNSLHFLPDVEPAAGICSHSGTRSISQVQHLRRLIIPVGVHFFPTVRDKGWGQGSSTRSWEKHFFMRLGVCTGPLSGGEWQTQTVVRELSCERLAVLLRNELPHSDFNTSN